MHAPDVTHTYIGINKELDYKKGFLNFNWLHGMLQPTCWEGLRGHSASFRIIPTLHCTVAYYLFNYFIIISTGVWVRIIHIFNNFWPWSSSSYWVSQTSFCSRSGSWILFKVNTPLPHHIQYSSKSIIYISLFKLIPLILNFIISVVYYISKWKV